MCQLGSTVPRKRQNRRGTLINTVRYNEGRAGAEDERLFQMQGLFSKWSSINWKCPMKVFSSYIGPIYDVLLNYVFVRRLELSRIVDINLYFRSGWWLDSLIKSNFYSVWGGISHDSSLKIYLHLVGFSWLNLQRAAAQVSSSQLVIIWPVEKSTGAHKTSYHVTFL